MILWGFDLFKGAEEIFLLGGELDGCFDDDAEEKVALTLAMDVWESFAVHSEHLSRLDSFRDSDFAGNSKRGRDFFFAAKRCFDKGNGEF